MNLSHEYYFLLVLCQVGFSAFLFMETHNTIIFTQMVWSSIFLIAGRIIITQVNILLNICSVRLQRETLQLIDSVMHVYTLGVTSFLSYVLLTNSIPVVFTLSTILIEVCNGIYFMYVRHTITKQNTQYIPMDEQV